MPEPVVDNQLPVMMADEPVDAPIEQPSVEAVPAPVESVQVAPAVEPPPPQPSSPIDLSSTLQQAGLVMIQTTSSPVTSPDTAAMPPQPLGRKPKPAVMITNEPLQMVETKNN
jgi:ribonuclease E